MKNIEYVLSLTLALLMLCAMVAWSAATGSAASTVLTCQAGRSSAPVILRGTSIYVGCTAPKRSKAA